MLFRERIAESTNYLEYGCGGSTVYACTQEKIKNIISVDTDMKWINLVSRLTYKSEKNIIIDHVNLGETGEWGYPKSLNGHGDFWIYSVKPWISAKTLGVSPDTVLIDGRFRVACFLYTLISAPVGTVVIFDDYFDRPHYFEVEKFEQVVTRAGRVAVFKVSNGYDLKELVVCYAKFTQDWR
jgi:hypothetical protein